MSKDTRARRRRVLSILGLVLIPALFAGTAAALLIGPRAISSRVGMWLNGVSTSEFDRIEALGRELERSPERPLTDTLERVFSLVPIEEVLGFEASDPDRGLYLDLRRYETWTAENWWDFDERASLRIGSAEGVRGSLTAKGFTIEDIRAALEGPLAGLIDTTGLAEAQDPVRWGGAIPSREELAASGSLPIIAIRGSSKTLDYSRIGDRVTVTVLLRR